MSPSPLPGSCDADTDLTHEVEVALRVPNDVTRAKPEQSGNEPGLTSTPVKT